MRDNVAMLILFLGFTTCCVTEKAQKIQDNTQATPASIHTPQNDEQSTQPDTQNNERLTYEPAVVELKGKLITKTFFGPPNYGENPDTDSKEDFAILVLRKAVNVRGEPDPYSGYARRSAKHVSRIQLVLRTPHKDFIGKKVMVKGTLFEANTGHHHTEVLMDVQSISLAAPD